MKPHVAKGANPEALHTDTVAAERRHFGGIKFGSAFFGWMTATGISVLLLALATAVAAAVGAAEDVDPSTLMNQAAQNLQAVSIAGGIILAVILFISYYCGGYVAGRMARFNGVRQGLAVWLWAVIATAVAGLRAALTGAGIADIFLAFPGIAVNEEIFSSGGMSVLIIALLVALAGAVLGGEMGMRFHRRADQAPLNDQVRVEKLA
jgi:hypothetical protein